MGFLAILLYIALRAALYGIVALIAVAWLLGLLIVYAPERVKRGYYADCL